MTESQHHEILLSREISKVDRIEESYYRDHLILQRIMRFTKAIHATLDRAAILETLWDTLVDGFPQATNFSLLTKAADEED